jgi:lipoprotein NlpD
VAKSRRGKPDTGARRTFARSKNTAKNMVFKKFSIFFIGFFVLGCTGISQDSYLKKNIMIRPTDKGFFHTVKKGETLWGISQYYCVNLNKLAEYNKIYNTKDIEIGQKIFIPDFLAEKNKKCDGELESLFIWPYKGRILTGFNESRQCVKNRGIDIVAKPGDSINAAAAGNIIFTSDHFRGYGKTIIIEHSSDFFTVYANNKENLVKTGDYVRQGQVIAKAGSTGRAQSCLVHFELRKNNKPQNPVLYLP